MPVIIGKSNRQLLPILQGIAACSSGEIFAYWSAPSERFFLISFISSGMMVGIMLSYPISGSIAYYLGWRAVFYITGTSRSEPVIFPLYVYQIGFIIIYSFFSKLSFKHLLFRNSRTLLIFKIQRIFCHINWQN